MNNDSDGYGGGDHRSGVDPDEVLSNEGFEFEDQGPPKQDEITLTKAQIDLLAEVLPKAVVEEKQLDARQAVFKTGRAGKLEDVLDKLEEAEPTKPEGDDSE